MSKNTNDWLAEDLPATQFSATEKRSHFPKVRQNPFPIVWSKLVTLFQASKTSGQSEVPEDFQSEQREPEAIRERYLYACFTDRVDPSLYYILFFPHQRY